MGSGVYDRSRNSRRSSPSMTVNSGFFCLAVLIFVLILPASSHAYQERLIVAKAEGNCTLRIEADDQERTLRLRVQPEGSGCQCSKQAMQAIIQAALTKTEPPRLEGTYTTLFLGRLVSYPWLMHALVATAATDPRWHRKRARPVSLELHAYVQRVLIRPEILAPLNEVLQSGGYRVGAVTVEKVGVARRDEVPGYTGPVFSGRVPYDAMVWLRLERD